MNVVPFHPTPRLLETLVPFYLAGALAIGLLLRRGLAVVTKTLLQVETRD